MTTNQTSTTNNSTSTPIVPSNSFADLMLNAGLEDIDYVSKQFLAENEVVFCVQDISIQQVVDSKFGIDQQWRLKILTHSNSGIERSYYVSVNMLDENSQREKVVNAVKDALSQLPEGAKIVHGLVFRKVDTAKYENGSFYKLSYFDTASNKVACSCNK